MKKYIFLFILVNILVFELSDAQRKRYTKFKHTGTGRYLSRDGHAGARFVATDNSMLFDLFPANGKTLLLTYPWQDDTPQYALDIENGCRQNATVRTFNLNRSRNQLWTINSDGSISSGCNPNWLLISDNYGVQQVRDKSIVPAADQVWQQSQGTEYSLAGTGYGKK